MNIKVEDNPTVTRKLREIRNGDEKWKLEHLSSDKRVQNLFTQKVAPLARMKAAGLDPWSNLNVDQVQVIIDQVYGAGMYEVTEDSAWLGLVTARLQSWCNHIAKKAIEAVENFLKDNKSDMEKMVHKERQGNPHSELTVNDIIADQIKAYLSKKPVYDGSELHMYAYQWANWNGSVDSKGFGEGHFVLSTFANGYLTQIGDYGDDHDDERPIGALILAMQAAGRVLEQWETGDSSDKVPNFSADNYGDIVTKAKGDPKISKKSTRIRRATVFIWTLREMNDTQWKELMINAHQHLRKGNKNMKSRDRATSAATLVEEDDEEDPDGDFVMVFA